MAVTSTFKRVRHNPTVPIFTEVCTATLSGTYATGGFTWNPFSIVSGVGSSALPASVIYSVDFYTSTGYTYVTTVAGSVATTKIFASGATELANTTAVPDATLTVILTKGR